MPEYEVRVFPSTATPPREAQLAWRLASLAADRTAAIDDSAAEMVANRFLDNAAVAIAALDRDPVRAAYAQALDRTQARGARLQGLDSTHRVQMEWAAWANGVAVRELDMHDTFLAADYAHPADNLPPLLAVAQATRRSGLPLLRACLVAYEVHIALVKAICLHRHKKDHIAHLCPAQAAGLGALLELPG